MTLRKKDRSILDDLGDSKTNGGEVHCPTDVYVHIYV